MGAEDHSVEKHIARQKLDELSSKFISSTSRQGFTERFEYVAKNFLLPALAYAEASFERKPILTLFTGIFFILGAIPFFTYAIVCGTALAGYCFVALASLLVASLATLIPLSTILLAVLAGAGLASAFVTAMLVSAFLFIRLAILVRQDGKDGAAEWLSDVKEYITGVFATLPYLSKSAEKRSSTPSPQPDAYRETSALKPEHPTENVYTVSPTLSAPVVEGTAY
ncbi:hypothetical protein D9611_008545 [Ephemerocybe angulata]|uniref:Uncharacterized protein n=1 Tax=Ephemerocybe angulata TaxID=980116 RepID=A0A8H5AQK1_9AGAR|nr:hypothetical protein D9611_014786 [Tulosesus angulatus]KAF5313498.1 hypothetical protein D9611_008545 [Tulosesus angulatus]